MDSWNANKRLFAMEQNKVLFHSTPFLDWNLVSKHNTVGDVSPTMATSVTGNNLHR